MQLAIQQEIEVAVRAVLDSGQFILGPEVASFEEEFAALHGAAWGIGTNSGASALHLALLSAGVGPGHEVVLPAFAPPTAALAVSYAGARPVFADVEPLTLTLDPEAAAAATTPRTRAIVATHLDGYPADLEALRVLAGGHGIVLIEDASAAPLARVGGRPVGGQSDLACFGFGPGQPLAAAGDGGIVLTSDPERAEAMRLLRNWGASRKYHHERQGYNYRLEGVQGAILRVKLRHLPAWTEARRTNARAYREALAGHAQLWMPGERPSSEPVYSSFCVGVADRERSQAKLAQAGLITHALQGLLLPRQPAWASAQEPTRRFPVAERWAATAVALPMRQQSVLDPNPDTPEASAWIQALKEEG